MIESLEEYLETLSGYVFDNDKVVTYKWLSKELEVHVNIAKYILSEFWKKHKDANIESTTMLMGFLESGDMRVEVVKDSNLENAKKKFSKIISEHLYSVQKALPDIELLSIAGDGDVRFSAIKCTECVERTDEELAKLRWGNSYKDHDHSNEKDTVKSSNYNEASTSTSTSTNMQSKHTDKTSFGAKKGSATQKNRINNFFGKATEKRSSETKNDIINDKVNKASENEKKDSVIEEKSKRSPISNKETKKKAMDRFLEKNVPSAIDNTNKNTKKENKDNLKATEKETESKHETATKSNNKHVENKRGVKRTRAKQSKPDTTKKRKRIMTIDSSSESETDASDHEEIPDSPENIAPEARETTPPPPAVKYENGRRRVLKMVDKTYEEDGFLVTKKVHVYESCSEDEEEVKAQAVKKKEELKPKPQVESKKKNSNNKQTTLMNFFKKS